MKVQQARTMALALPGATEEPHFDKTSFRVGKKIFATVPPGGTILNVFLDEDEIRACVAQDPESFAELRWGKKLVGVSVLLHKANADEVGELLEEAWHRKAPKRVVAAREAAGKADWR